MCSSLRCVAPRVDSHNKQASMHAHPQLDAAAAHLKHHHHYVVASTHTTVATTITHSTTTTCTLPRRTSSGRQRARALAGGPHVPAGAGPAPATQAGSAPSPALPHFLRGAGARPWRRLWRLCRFVWGCLRRMRRQLPRLCRGRQTPGKLRPSCTTTPCLGIMGAVRGQGPEYTVAWK